MIKNTGKKILVLGGTGAMGVYLVPELVRQGHHVHVVSLDDIKSDNPQLTYTQANAMDDEYLRELLKPGWDAIVDFMVYSTEHFRKRHEILLGSTEHMIYLSSYRVYADSDSPITESSPQLLDVSTDMEFLASDDYALAKARQEDILENSKYSNWTICRPAITYSKYRYQLVTLEAYALIYRAMNHLLVVLPEEAMPIQATMTWAGDVAKMMSRLVLNPAAYRESYTMSTAEHNRWEEVAGYYKELIGLQAVTTDTESYLKIIGGTNKAPWARWQLNYDRLFNRVVDNTKILKAVGLKQSDLMLLKDGLRLELNALPSNASWKDPNNVNERMDAFLRER